MESKSILVGGDYQGFMDKIDSYLAQHNCGQLSVYSFVGIAELYKSITTKTTQLLILNYWNNVEVINELCRFLTYPIFIYSVLQPKIVNYKESIIQKWLYLKRQLRKLLKEIF